MRIGLVMFIFVGIAASLPAQVSQPAALMNNADVQQMCVHLTELMEAEGVAIPGLDRAGAPVVESTRQNCIQLQIQPARASHTYALVENVRAFLALADALPKPYPFPEAAERQFAELRSDSTRLDSHFRALAESLDRRLVSPDPANLARYVEANHKLGAPDPAKPRVVFFGDSITDYWRLNEYFPGNDYINRGIAGQTTGEMLQRFQADVAAARPQAVLILAGTNDLARNIPVAAIESNYQMLATLAGASGIKVLFASVTPVDAYHKDQNPAYERTPSRSPMLIRELNDWLKAYCAKQRFVYVDYFSSMLDERGQLALDMTDDGLHPNAKGYRIMGPLASAAIQRALPAPKSQAPAAEPAKSPKRLFPFIMK